MKPLYYVIISVVLIIIIAVIANNRNKQRAADLNVATTQNEIINSDSSQTASILNALFPYFQTGVSAATNKPK